MSKKNDIAIVFLGITVGVILWVTILGRESAGKRVYYQPFHSFMSLEQGMKYGLTGNLIGNILLFVPFGYLLAVVIKSGSSRKPIAFGAILSLVIEIIQFVTCRGAFDLDDILLNIVGTVIGYWLLIFTQDISKRLKRRKETEMIVE